MNFIYWRDGQHSAASGRSQKSSYDSYLSGTTSLGKSSGGYSGGGIGILDTIFLGFDSLIGFIGRIMIVILVIGIVILIFMFQLARVGILKSKVTISLDLVSNTDMALEDFQLSLARFDDENGKCIEYVGEFDPDSNSSTIKVPKGEYTLFFEYGGEKFSIESLSVTGLQNYTGEFTDENLLIMRVVEITFQNNEGDIIHSEQLSIVNSDGDDISAELLENGTYTVLLSNDCGEEDWLISADGYESKEVNFDGEIARVIDIEQSDDGVLLRVPCFVTDKTIEKIIRNNEEWIQEKLDALAADPKPEPVADRLSMDEIQALAKRAKEVIPKRVAYYAPLVGVTYGRITIRNQKTRWGSCSSKGNLNFNCLLMLAPPEVLDSIVVHELCHRKQMNHFKAFYAEVLRVFPDYHKWNGWLKENGLALMRRMTG